MPTFLHVENLSSFVMGFSCVLSRVSGFCVSVPLLSAKMLPMFFRVQLIVTLSVFIFFQNPNAYSLDMNIYWLLNLMVQFIIGVSIGLIIQMIIEIFIFGAQLIGMQAGLGFASVLDPQVGTSSPLLGQIYLLLSMFIFLSLNGHLKIIEFLNDTFSWMPNIHPVQWLEIVKFSGNIFSIGVLMALPVISALLILNVAFAIMTRSAPSLNIFNIGFPITMIFGLFLIYLNLQYESQFIQNGFSEFISQIALSVGRIPHG